jgi:hypothetical protein
MPPISTSKYRRMGRSQRSSEQDDREQKSAPFGVATNVSKHENFYIQIIPTYFRSCRGILLNNNNDNNDNNNEREMIRNSSPDLV